MNHSRRFSLVALLLIAALLFGAPATVLAQTDQPDSTTVPPEPLLVYTDYPSQLIGFGEVVSVSLKFRAGTPQIVNLSVEDLPEGWTATFQGGSNIISAVYVQSTKETTVTLRLEPPADVKAGEYAMTVIAEGKDETSELPLRFTIKEKLPPRLSLSMNGLPTKRGNPDSTFSYTAELKNEGGEDLVVTLSATEPQNMRVLIKSSGQQVTEIQLPANDSQTLTIEADPLVNMPTGSYPFTVRASAGDVEAQLDLVAEVIGEGDMMISAPDGRLSADATAGKETPMTLVLANHGTAPLRGIELSSSAPSGWSVTFDQDQIAEIPAGQSVEVTARVTPPEKAVAGDYVVTFRARPVEMSQESVEFRITVRTSTVWGVAGVGLIAVAVGVVGMAVMRFGRR